MAQSRSLTGYYAVSEGVLMDRLKGSPFGIYIIQAYAQTFEKDEEEVKNFYAVTMRGKVPCKPHDIIIGMGDLHAKLGRDRGGDDVGPFGLGEQNERGDRWEEWCNEN